jgi:hypothetical protein
VRGTSGKFDPVEVTRQYAELCTAYKIHTVVGDAYGREWVAGAWRSAGKEYTRSPRPKGELYLESLPVFTRGLARLPDHARLVRVGETSKRGERSSCRPVDRRASAT